MGLRKMQEDLQQKKEQETSLITDLTTALEQSKAESSSLLQQLQKKQQELSSLKAELTETYKKIESLNSSDLELQKAQQLRQNAKEDLESSRQLMREQKSLQQQNEQKEKDLQNSRNLLEKQKKELADKENSLQKTIEDAKKQAEDDAAAALADGWKELEKAKDKASKQAEDDRQHVEDLREAAERELVETKKAKADAAKKGYQDTVSTYRLAIYAMMLFCVILGLVEVYKHKYIFDVYVDWYITLSSYIGFLPAFGVAAIAAIIFLAAYFVPLKDSDGLYFGLTIRLIVLVTLFASTANDYKEIAAGIIYFSGVVIGFIRLKNA